MHGFENNKFIFYTAGKIGTRTLMYTKGMRSLKPPQNYELSLRKETFDLIISKKKSRDKKIVILVRENGDISFFNDPSFWANYIEMSLQFSPRVWSPHKEFDSNIWQYHVGNWLHDAEAISEIFTDSIILNIKDLSNFLVSNDIPDSHLNPYSNIVPAKYEYATKEVFDTFIQGLESLPHIIKQFTDYLQPEKECYERLINSPQYYKVG